MAYTLGLRHALDADHIAAIDLMTRRLVASGQRPVAVGTFFSLGHSTIVVITSVAVAATSASLSERFDSFSRVGGVIGTSVSAAFLIVLAILNGYVLYKLVRRMRTVLEQNRAPTAAHEAEENVLAKALQGSGCLVRAFKGAFRMIDRSWKMYPLGVLCTSPVPPFPQPLADGRLKSDWASTRRRRWRCWGSQASRQPRGPASG